MVSSNASVTIFNQSPEGSGRGEFCNGIGCLDSFMMGVRDVVDKAEFACAVECIWIGEAQVKGNSANKVDRSSTIMEKSGGNEEGQCLWTSERKEEWGKRRDNETDTVLGKVIYPRQRGKARQGKAKQGKATCCYDLAFISHTEAGFFKKVSFYFLLSLVLAFWDAKRQPSFRCPGILRFAIPVNAGLEPLTLICGLLSCFASLLCRGRRSPLSFHKLFESGGHILLNDDGVTVRMISNKRM